MLSVHVPRDPNRADDGDPSPAPSTWPLYTTDTREHIILNTTGPATDHGMRDRQCAFWRDFVPKLATTGKRMNVYLRSDQ